MAREHIIFKSKKRLLRGSLKYFGFFVLGLALWALALKADMILIGAAALMPVFGLGACIWKLWQLRGDQSLLVLSPKGLQYDRWKKLTIPWSAIADGGIHLKGDGYGGARRLLYIALDQSIPMEALPKHMRKIIKKSRKAKQPDLLIDLRDSDTSPEQALELLRQFRARY